MESYKLPFCHSGARGGRGREGSPLGQGWEERPCDGARGGGEAVRCGRPGGARLRSLGRPCGWQDRGWSLVTLRRWSLAPGAVPRARAPPSLCHPPTQAYPSLPRLATPRHQRVGPAELDLVKPSVLRPSLPPSHPAPPSPTPHHQSAGPAVGRASVVARPLGLLQRPQPSLLSCPAPPRHQRAGVPTRSHSLVGPPAGMAFCPPLALFHPLHCILSRTPRHQRAGPVVGGEPGQALGAGGLQR